MTSQSRLRARQGASSVTVLTPWPHSPPDELHLRKPRAPNCWTLERRSQGSGTQQAEAPSVNYFTLLEHCGTPPPPPHHPSPTPANRPLLWVRLKTHESTGSRKRSRRDSRCLPLHMTAWLLIAVRKPFKRAAALTSSCCKEWAQPYWLTPPFSPSAGGQESAVGWQGCIPPKAFRPGINPFAFSSFDFNPTALQSLLPSGYLLSPIPVLLFDNSVHT